jgi:hypothetical protein
MKSNAIFSKYSAKKWNTVTVSKNEIQFQCRCQKMKYSANFIDYKIQPFLAENNTKNPNSHF